MATITKDCCSYEVAKLLKEKGFPQEYDIYHSMVYNEEDYEDEYEVQRMVLETRLVKAGTLSSYPVGVPEPKCYCPTLQMAMKWLREEKGIAIIPVISSVLDNKKFLWDIKIVVAETYDTYSQGWVYEKQEAACEAAIKYCLENLI